MVRILVLSDSHRINCFVERAIAQTREEYGTFHKLIHLGDVGYPQDIEALAGMPCYIVRGNTDYESNLLEVNIIEVGGHRIFATHGHRYQVNFGLDMLRYAALENNCDIAMYGHTHVPFLEVNEDDVTILNPGSISCPRQEGNKNTFMIVTVEDDDMVTYELKELRPSS